MVRNPETEGGRAPDDGSGQPVAVLDAGTADAGDAVVLTANERFAAMLGLDRAAVVDTPLSVLADQAPLADALRGVVGPGLTEVAELSFGSQALRCEALPPELDGRRLVVVTGRAAPAGPGPADGPALQTLFRTAGFGIALAGGHGRIVHANPVLASWLGRTPTGLTGARLSDLVSAEDRPAVETALASVGAGRAASWQGEVRLARAVGGPTRVRLSAWPVPGPGETAVVATIEDLSAVHRAETEAYRAAQYDGDTGLPGRALFVRRVGDALARFGEQPTALVAVGFGKLPALLLALDPVEAEHLGFAIVDRLRQGAGPGALLGRLGDGVFGVLLPGEATPEAIEESLRRLAESFAQPIPAGGDEVILVPTLGASLHPRDAADAAGLVRAAGAALERAGERVTGRWALYEPRMAGATLARLSLEGRLRRALDRGELELHYQPQAEMAGLSVVGFEALLRWRDPDTSTFIPPAEFIPVAEDGGLILPLGEWVLDEACRQMAAWRRDGLPELPVSVNLSGRQLADPHLCRTALDTLARHGVPAHRLKVELTETVLFGSSGGDRQALMQLHQAGVRLLLDDFGTGYSSLSYLKRFPIEALKIDRSFVQGMVGDPDTALIVQTTVNMAHALGMRVVAEGVETAEELTFLRAYRCDQVQGYLIAKPLPAPAAADLLRDGR